MTEHLRLRLSRRKGTRLPAGAVSVARPGRWGNQHRVDALGQQQAVDAYRTDLRAGRLPVTVVDVRAELAGRDLGCWCRPEQPCHADALLQVANEQPQFSKWRTASGVTGLAREAGGGIKA